MFLIFAIGVDGHLVFRVDESVDVEAIVHRVLDADIHSLIAALFLD
jgi:hypothetical protein